MDELELDDLDLLDFAKSCKSLRIFSGLCDFDNLENMLARLV